MKIPTEFEDLFYEKNFAHVATINPDGSPQVTPMWVDYNKKQNEIRINTATGRKKARNMKTGSMVALSISDSNNAYRYIGIQGEVLEVTTVGALDHINSLSKKYLDKDKYPLPEGEIRVLIRIKPKFVHTMG
ncbi:PPOX class F420-dependent oxidoreductase [Candidatus Heimdallarchaeota archaeon]|nr:MAG: PPOX class F420-dependent oxidoreductase [Candidatus Heimdallarchaeota archaeon]